MDYEATLNQALDLLADGEDRRAGRILQSCIDHIKANLTDSDSDLDRWYYWGRCLTAMEEFEQALLKFENVLRINAEHEPTLWETASIFLHDLDRPESARPILADKLLKINPENPLYQETLRAAEFCMRIKTNPPPGAVDDWAASSDQAEENAGGDLEKSDEDD